MKTLKKGFTLIELLIVVAIIGILATVIILNVASAREKAANNSLLSDATNAGKAATACITDGGTPTVPADAATFTCTGLTSGTVAAATVTNWPDVGTGSKYVNWSYSTTTGDNAASSSAFKMTVVDNSTTQKKITCDQGGCVKTNF